METRSGESGGREEDEWVERRGERGSEPSRCNADKPPNSEDIFSIALGSATEATLSVSSLKL